MLTALDGIVLAAAERRPVHRTVGELLPLALGPHLVHALTGLMTAVLWRSPYGPLSALLVLLPMYLSCWVFAQYHREQSAHRATIRALVHAVDIKDTYTRGHSERVGRASVLIARELGMDDRRVEGLRFAGILHDIGKLGRPHAGSCAGKVLAGRSARWSTSGSAPGTTTSHRWSRRWDASSRGAV
ncbi:hypothetical protein SBADM41S_02946 [Streptomyces badius]